MTNIRRLALAAFSIFLSVGAIAQDTGERRVLTADDLLALRSVNNPVISPDGAWIAYTVGVDRYRGG